MLKSSHSHGIFKLQILSIDLPLRKLIHLHIGTGNKFELEVKQIPIDNVHQNFQNRSLTTSTKIISPNDQQSCEKGSQNVAAKRLHTFTEFGPPSRRSRRQLVN